jgi:hypothetical protein
MKNAILMLGVLLFLLIAWIGIIASVWIALHHH